MQEYPLFEKYPKLKAIPRIEMGRFPTPVQKLEKISKINPKIDVYIKRDEFSYEPYGGNKVRKYEFFFADAMQKNKTNILTTGGIGSNHAVANSIFCTEYGLNSYVYLTEQQLTTQVHQNLLLDFHFGAKMKYTKSILRTALAMAGKVIFDRKAYLVMPGGSTALGSLGFVNAAFELQKQINAGEIPKIDELFVASGSTGTCAGLTLGLELLNSPIHVTGVGVTLPLFSNKNAVMRQIKSTLNFMRKRDPDIPDVWKKIEKRLDVDTSFFGGVYGKPTNEGLHCIRELKEEEITLDPTYTGKAFSCLYNRLQSNKSNEKKNYLFWNTLNIRDYSDIWKNRDYKKLPEVFHKYFDGTVPLDETPVWCCDEHEDSFKKI